MATPSISASARTIDDWMTILDPLGYWQAADVILNDLHDYPQAGEHREEDKKQLGNALVPWAMLTASQIESELGWATDRPPTPRKGDALLWALDRAMKAPLALWLTAIAVLVWLAIPAPSSFEMRWPIALPPAMSLQTFGAARRAGERPAARRGFCYPRQCKVV